MSRIASMHPLAAQEIVEVLSCTSNGPTIRSVAALVLGSLGEDAAGTFPELMTIASNQNDPILPWVVSAMGELRAEAKEAVPHLTLVIETESRKDVPSDLLTASIIAVGNIGQSSRELIDLLQRIRTQHGDEDVRLDAEYAYSRIVDREEPNMRWPTFPKVD